MEGVTENPWDVGVICLNLTMYNIIFMGTIISKLLLFSTFLKIKYALYATEVIDSVGLKASVFRPTACNEQLLN